MFSGPGPLWTKQCIDAIVAFKINNIQLVIHLGICLPRCQNNIKRINLYNRNYFLWIQNARQCGDHVFALKYTPISSGVPTIFLELTLYILNEVVWRQKGGVKTGKIHMSMFLVNDVDIRLPMQMLHNGHTFYVIIWCTCWKNFPSMEDI